MRAVVLLALLVLAPDGWGAQRPTERAGSGAVGPSSKTGRAPGDSGLGGSARSTAAGKTSMDVAGSEAIGRLFEKLDLDRDGKLSAPELERLATPWLGRPVDFDGDGVVSRADVELSFLFVLGTELVGEGHDRVWRFQQCQSLLDAGYPRAAAADMERLLAKYPDSKDAWWLFGRALALAGDSRRAQEVYDKALQMTQDEVSLREAWATAAVHGGKPQEADDAIDELLATMDARLKLAGPGSSRDEEIKLDKACLIGLIGAVRQHHHRPGRPGQLVRWGIERFGRSGELEKLEAELYGESAALPKELPPVPEPLLERVQKLLDEGMTHEAAELLRRMAGCYRDSRRVWWKLAEVLALTGSQEESRQAYDAGLQNSAGELERKLQWLELISGTGTVEDRRKAVDDLLATLEERRSRPCSPAIAEGEKQRAREVLRKMREVCSGRAE